MRYSRNAITQLKRQYKSVLLKCALINAALFMAAAPAMAYGPYQITEDIAAGMSLNQDNAVVVSSVTNNGTMQIEETLEIEDASLTNNNLITADDIYNEEGTFINNSTGRVITQYFYNDDEYSTVFNNGLIAGRIDNQGIFINGATLTLDEDFQASLIATGSGTINGDVYNYGEFHNYGTLGAAEEYREYDVNNYGTFINAESGVINADAVINSNGNVDGDSLEPLSISPVVFASLSNHGIINSFYNLNGGGYSYNDGSLTGLVYMNEGGQYHNEADVRGSAMANSGVTRNNGTMDFSYWEDEEVIELAKKIAVEEPDADDLEEFRAENPNLVVNAGTMYNGVDVSISANDEEVDLTKPRIIMAEMPESQTAYWGAGQGKITGDIYNGMLPIDDDDDDDALSIGRISSIYSHLRINPFNGAFASSYSVLLGAPVLWNNDTIDGDIYNTAMLVNGVTYSTSMTYEVIEEEDMEGIARPIFGETQIEGVAEATINASVIANMWGRNPPTIINGGVINANKIYNDFRIENGIIMGGYIPVSSSEEEPEPVFIKTAEINAEEIYNMGFIHNAGTITGDVYNVGYAYTDEETGEIEVDGSVAAIALHNATIDGNVLSKVMDEADEAQMEEDLEKFNVLSATGDALSEDYEPEDLDTDDLLYGSMQTFGGDSEVTGAIKIASLGIHSGSSLKVGGDIRVHELEVGDGLAKAYAEPTTVIDSEFESEPETARLDIGSNKAEAGYAYFDADSTLALTVENSETYGQVVAGDFEIETGAQLEVTVLPDDSFLVAEGEEPVKLQLLKLEEESDLIRIMSEEEIDLDDGDGDLDLDDDSGDDEEEGGFNNFTENFINGESGDAMEAADDEDESILVDDELFTIKRVDDEGTYSIVQKEKPEDIIIDPDPDPEPIEPLPVKPEPSPAPQPAPKPAPSDKTLELAGMAKAWLSDGKMTTSAAFEMQKELLGIARKKGNRQGLVDALTALAPNDAPVAQVMSAAIMGRIFGGIGAHLSKPKSGLASGDMLSDVSAWGSTYYGNAKLDDRADGVYGFDADSKGITAGVDKKVIPAVKLGLGVQYDKSDIDAFKRDVDVETVAVFGYGEYRPNNWFINGVAAYGRSDYDEKKYVGTKTIKADYSADLFGLQAMTGYDVITRYADITPSAGLRYNYIKRHGYIDGADQAVSGHDSDIFTGVVGLRAAKNYSGFRPSAYINFTYDMVSDRDSATVGLKNGSSYTVSGKRLNQFGVEAGAALEYNCGNWDFAANYDYAGRRHFNSHTGMLTAKYNF